MSFFWVNFKSKHHHNKTNCQLWQSWVSYHSSYYVKILHQIITQMLYHTLSSSTYTTVFVMTQRLYKTSYLYKKKLITSLSYSTKPYLMIHDLCKCFVHTITSLMSHHQTDFKMSHYHVVIESFSHNILTSLHKHIIIAAFSSL